jgi:FKBP-type peptidyl-prolyl cis-trans isomerase SlyD
MNVSNEKFVTLSYVLTVEGEVADMATAENPLGFVFGAGMLLPAFEKNIDGKQVGDKFEFTLTPEEGYGVSDERMIVELPQDTFKVDDAIEEGLLTIGNEIPMMTAEGMRLLGRVIAIGETMVTMDFNHPMAGQTLNFTGEIVGVREATDEDMPGQQGGCGCGCGSDGCGDCGGGCGGDDDCDCGEGGCDCGK